jgi:hypothetical protein
MPMQVLLDPFRLFGRLMLASFRITGYTATFLIQVAGFIYYRRRDKIVEAFGSYGHGITDALADIFAFKR